MTIKGDWIDKCKETKNQRNEKSFFKNQIYLN